MSLLARVRNILLSPLAEWRIIATERTTIKSLLGRYVVPMALVPAVASFIGYGLVGANGILFRMSGPYWGVSMAMNSFITSLAVYFLGTFLIDRLGPGFGASRDLGRSAQLVAYSYTPAWLAGVFYALPGLQQGVVLGLYSVYLFYTGVPSLKTIPEDQRITYTIVSAILLITIRFLVGLLLSDLIYSFASAPFIWSQSQ
ncbi:MAG TPA: Yip1 family protein [Puia sp.]|nr:Yip1 family protein [Puia sp.]